MFLLAGDVGGTKTDLAIYSSEIGLGQPIAETTLPSGDYTSLDDLVQAFVYESGVEIERACFGVAGPVVNGRATITNLPWIIEEAKLAETLHATSVSLLNDLDAVARSIAHLGKSDWFVLNAGEAAPRATRAVIAPGTGLGEAFLTWTGETYKSYPSEGGHTDFAPRGAMQSELLAYLFARHGHVSYERVCSGIGIPNIYGFLRESGRGVEPAWLAKRLDGVKDPLPIISAAARGEVGYGPVQLCIDTLHLFISIFGAEAGNLALKVWATGGVYIGGGVVLHMLGLLTDDTFGAAFRDKGRMSPLMEKIPVRVILHKQPALLGAARHALERLTWT